MKTKRLPQSYETIYKYIYLKININPLLTFERRLLRSLAPNSGMSCSVQCRNSPAHRTTTSVTSGELCSIARWTLLLCTMVSIDFPSSAASFQCPHVSIGSEYEVMIPLASVVSKRTAVVVSHSDDVCSVPFAGAVETVDGCMDARTRIRGMICSVTMDFRRRTRISREPSSVMD